MAQMPHGSADWAELPIAQWDGLWATDGGVPIGYYTDRTEGSAPRLTTHIRYTGDRHVCLVAPNGSGKSMRCALPFALSSVHWSLAICDVKGEFLELTHDYRKKARSQILVLNPFGKQSHGFNPIASLPVNDELPDDALELAEAVVRVEGREPHWAQAAQEVVSALIMYVLLTIPNGSFKDVRELLSKDDAGWRRLVHGGRDTIQSILRNGRKTNLKTSTQIIFRQSSIMAGCCLECWPPLAFTDSPRSRTR
jgi:type IV secretory pathway TraG/TraD family ATPase VirD4